MSRLKKTLFLLFISITAFILLVIVFISPITKYLVEKYDVKYLGREITMDWAYVNPFSGYVHFNNLVIKEEKSDNTFILVKGLSANFSMLKLCNKTIEISEVTLSHPVGKISQAGKILNFTDIINRFSNKEAKHVSKSEIKFSMLDISIVEGIFYYQENTTPINYFIKNVNIQSPGKSFDSDSMLFIFAFESGIKTGKINGNLAVDFKTLDYRLNVIANKFDLTIIQQYLRDLTNYGTFTANVEGKVEAKGNFNSKEDVNAKGIIAINDFHFGKNSKEDYTSFEKVTLQINELCPKNKKYDFDSISLIRPYFKYERYDKLDNIQTMFGKGGSNINTTTSNPDKFNLVVEIAKYVKVLARNFFKSDYKVGRIAIYNADLKYNDYSLNDKFSVQLNPMYAFADSINKNNKRVSANIYAGIKPYGNLKIALSINPNDSSDFDIDYYFEKIPLTVFNPYLIQYTSFPMDRGTIALNGKWKVINGSINSTNHIIIIDPRLTARIRNKSINWLPMKLVMYLVRERGNVIDYEVPITGNLKDPKFHFRDVIIDVVQNIFVKPATIPYITSVRTIETNIEKSMSIYWPMGNSELTDSQIRFIKRIVVFLKDNPEAKISIFPILYAEKEKELILLYEAKKRYYSTFKKIELKSFTVEDSLLVSKMSIKDTLFIHYLGTVANDTLAFSVQEKCARFIDSSFVNSKFNRLLKSRKAIFQNYFVEVEKQIVYSTPLYTVPFNGFSNFKINYKNEFPESLINDYRLMNDLNDEAPRLKFKPYRVKSNL
jgi:hypothetical protein